MKPDIHPKYYQAKVHCGSCGTEWTVGSTRPELRVDVCANCHPFFTGKQTIIDTAGQVERFQKRLERQVRTPTRSRHGGPVRRSTRVARADPVDCAMPSFTYGGQALIEGVLMRGRDAIAVALRHPDGEIVCADGARSTPASTARAGRKLAVHPRPGRPVRDARRRHPLADPERQRPGRRTRASSSARARSR